MNVVLKAESISGKLENSKTVRGASAMSNSCGQVFTSYVYMYRDTKNSICLTGKSVCNN